MAVRHSKGSTAGSSASPTKQADEGRDPVCLQSSLPSQRKAFIDMTPCTLHLPSLISISPSLTHDCKPPPPQQSANPPAPPLASFPALHHNTTSVFAQSPLAIALLNVAPASVHPRLRRRRPAGTAASLSQSETARVCSHRSKETPPVLSWLRLW